MSLLIAFEGLDQSGKQTQSELLRDRLTGVDGRLVRLLSFPAYGTPIGGELQRALGGIRDYRPDVMQLLYIANRYELKPDIERERECGTIVICDRYSGSSLAYGEAQGLDRAWLHDVQRHLPQPDATILLDIPPEISARRKTEDRDQYERDLDLLARVRDAYRREAAASGWVVLDAARDRHVVAEDVYAAVMPLLKR